MSISSLFVVMLVGTHVVFIGSCEFIYCFFHVVTLKDCLVYHNIRESGWICREVTETG